MMKSTASLLDIQYKKDSVENKPASSFVVTLGMVLKGAWHLNGAWHLMEILSICQGGWSPSLSQVKVKKKDKILDSFDIFVS